VVVEKQLRKTLPLFNAKMLAKSMVWAILAGLARFFPGEKVQARWHGARSCPPCLCNDIGTSQIARFSNVVIVGRAYASTLVSTWGVFMTLFFRPRILSHGGIFAIFKGHYVQKIPVNLSH
jgi:hypothetical protein